MEAAALSFYNKPVSLEHFSNTLQRRRKAGNYNGIIDVYKRQDLHSGATIYEAIGAYNMEKRNEIITIVDKGEYQKLMKYINQDVYKRQNME